MAYFKINFEYEDCNEINLDKIDYWRSQIKSILPILKDSTDFVDTYGPKFKQIYTKVIKNEQKTQNKNSISLEPKPVQEQNTEIIALNLHNFRSWKRNLKIRLCFDEADEALESPLEKNDFRNLIAIARIYMSVPPDLQIPIRNLEIAYNMIETLQNEYDTPSTNELVTKKRKL